MDSENWEQRSVELFEPIGANKLENMVDFLDKKELVPQPSECLEPERKGNNGKYNLRKSLAWDSAFFTSAGMVLCPCRLGFCFVLLCNLLIAIVEKFISFL